ncbi:MAG: MBL fold metallo-hydrolase [Bacteroidetes bacterium]|nr:MBL fold metallo-hydrolase [Bacteroidota bacterium]
MITIRVFEMNPFQENTLLLYDKTKECVIIDAGCYSEEECNELKSFIDSAGLRPVKLLNTHGHVDHIFGNAFVMETWDVSYEIHEADSILLNNAVSYASVYGFSMDKPPSADKFLQNNEIIRFGNSELKAIHVPGHSPGSVVFYSETQRFLIAGDVLFNGSIGRTDLPGGDYQALITGIRTKLLCLGDDIKVYCGHGPATTIGKERKTNPYVGY